MLNLNIVTVIGAGTMGHGIAQYFAMSGYKVFLYDRDSSFVKKGKEQIVQNLLLMEKIGVIGKGEAENILEKIELAEDLKKAAEQSDFITEVVTENIDIKKELFSFLDEVTEENVILATNTSSFDIDDISDGVSNKGRVIGTHWFHPPHITPCVEIIPSSYTSEETILNTIEIFKSMGKAPTICKSAPGFVANRIQYALVSESLALLEEGLATPEEIDRIVKTSFGFRLSAFGPIEVVDQAGIDVYNTIFKFFYKTFNREVFKPPLILQKYVDEGKFGLKTGRGFYSYQGDAEKQIKEERDTKLFDRLELYKKEFLRG